MARFRCRQCNYVFEPKVRGRVPERCPYCSEFNTLMEEKSIFNDLNIDDQLPE